MQDGSRCDEQPRHVDEESRRNEEESKRQEAESKLVRDESRLYPNEIIFEIGAFAAAVIATLFPVLSILVLYFIPDTLKRIYALLGLTVAFAALVRLVGSARSLEVFTVTAG